MITLRPYQSEAINRIRNSYRAGKKRPLFVLPTGGGKTISFTYITQQALERGSVVWLIAHKDDLIIQISETLKKFNIRHGIIQGSKPVMKHLKCQVVSVPTMAKRLGKYDNPDFIIIDEAHHSTAGSYLKILEYYPDAKVLGVTATPCRSDGRGLGDVYDDLVLGPSVIELINLGFLVAPKYYNPKSAILEAELKNIKKTAGDYNNKDLAEAVNKAALYGDIIANYRKYCNGVPAVVFCVNIKHADDMSQRFKAAGYSAANVDGTMDKSDVNEILRKLGTGEIQVVTSCNLISEGTDIPAIGCAILARPTKSLSLYIQQIGRALRPYGGKDHAIILDHANNFGEFGHPLNDRFWSLDGDRGKKRDKEKEEFEDKLNTGHCRSCGFVWLKSEYDGTKCPDCGAETRLKKELKELKDEMIEVKFDPKAVYIQKKPDGFRNYWPKNHSNLNRFEAFDILFKEKIKKNYKIGWVLHTFTARIKKVLNSGGSVIGYGLNLQPGTPEIFIETECKKLFNEYLKK
jgi:superfamily II DNA or RNA helicase